LQLKGVFDLRHHLATAESSADKVRSLRGATAAPGAPAAVEPMADPLVAGVAAGRSHRGYHARSAPHASCKTCAKMQARYHETVALQ